jgi:hypothetical protein
LRKNINEASVGKGEGLFSGLLTPVSSRLGKSGVKNEYLLLSLSRSNPAISLGLEKTAVCA